MHICIYVKYGTIYIYIYIYIYTTGPPRRKLHAARQLTSTTVSFHNFKSQNFKLSVSNPKNKCCLCVRTVSNFKLPGSRPQKQT